MHPVRGLLFNAVLVFAFVILSNIVRRPKTTMKAIISDGNKGIKLADVPKPEVKEGQILVKVVAAAQVRRSCLRAEKSKLTRVAESDGLASSLCIRVRKRS